MISSFGSLLYFMATGLTLTHTRVAAEGQFPSGCVGLSDVEIPVFVNAHGGGVSVPAGVGKQEVLKARQHLSGMRGDCKKFFFGVHVAEEAQGRTVNTQLHLHFIQEIHQDAVLE